MQLHAVFPQRHEPDPDDFAFVRETLRCLARVKPIRRVVMIDDEVERAANLVAEVCRRFWRQTTKLRAAVVNADRWGIQFALAVRKFTRPTINAYCELRGTRGRHQPDTGFVRPLRI